MSFRLIPPTPPLTSRRETILWPRQNRLRNEKDGPQGRCANRWTRGTSAPLIIPQHRPLPIHSELNSGDGRIKDFRQAPLRYFTPQTHPKFSSPISGGRYHRSPITHPRYILQAFMVDELPDKYVTLSR